MVIVLSPTVTVARLVHLSKAYSPIDVTELGITISLIDGHAENA